MSASGSSTPKVFKVTVGAPWKDEPSSIKFKISGGPSPWKNSNTLDMMSPLTPQRALPTSSNFSPLTNAALPSASASLPLSSLKFAFAPPKAFKDILAAKKDGALEDVSTKKAQKMANMSAVDLTGTGRKKLLNSDNNDDGNNNNSNCRNNTNNNTNKKKKKKKMRLFVDMDDLSTYIHGTCSTVEKEYFRLTSKPHPSMVRPYSVLQKTFALIKSKWVREHNYMYTCSQLKSIRQDCSVQGLKNAFTINVYETHARIALEQGDLGEFSQCLSQLQSLYNFASFQEGADGEGVTVSSARSEFLAYKILHGCLITPNSDVIALISSLSYEERHSDDNIAHALQVQASITSGNFAKFFKLHKTAPNMGGYIMDTLAASVRQSALQNILASYRPTLDVQWLCEVLAFPSMNHCLAFLGTYHATVTKCLVVNAEDGGTTYSGSETSTKISNEKNMKPTSPKKNRNLYTHTLDVKASVEGFAKWQQEQSHLLTDGREEAKETPLGGPKKNGGVIDLSQLTGDAWDVHEANEKYKRLSQKEDDKRQKMKTKKRDLEDRDEDGSDHTKKKKKKSDKKRKK